MANNDFLRICGKDCEGTLLPVGPVQMARSLPDSHPVKASALAYVEKYEAANGAGSVSSFGAYAWDAGVLLEAAVPAALKVAKPGSAEFRAALYRNQPMNSIHSPLMKPPRNAPSKSPRPARK